VVKAKRKSVKRSSKSAKKKSKKLVRKPVKKTAKKRVRKTVKKKAKKAAKKPAKKSVKKIAKKTSKKSTLTSKKTVKKKAVEKLVPQTEAKPVKKPVKLKPLFGKKELAPYRNHLLEIRRKIMNDVSHLEKDALMNTKDASGDLSGHSFHMADVATDNYDQELNLGLASSEQEILNTINDALKRVEDGTFGYSIKSGRVITRKRLAVVPYAELTIDEQEEEERLKKLRM